MKFKSKESQSEEITLNMTAMIDIVFQLLIFFIMTFRVTALEADFSIRMPSPSLDKSIAEIEPVVIVTKLVANDQRDLFSIDVETGGNRSSFSGTNKYKQLTAFVEKVITTETDPTSQDEIEVEFVIDQSLRYRHTVQAIESVYGRVENGEKIKLIEKIKFRPIIPK